MKAKEKHSSPRPKSENTQVNVGWQKLSWQTTLVQRNAHLKLLNKVVASFFPSAGGAMWPHALPKGGA